MHVSVIIATYGNPHWANLARRAFKSTSGQSAHEVIAHHDEHGSLAQVRNIAAAAATGEWLCFLDADDELAPDYLRRMQGAENEHITGPVQRAIFEGDRTAGLASINEILVPAVQYVYPNGKVTRPEIPNGGGTRPMIEINHIVIGALVPRWLFREVGGFDARWEHLEDYELWCRCIANGARVVHAPEAVYRAHVDPARQPRYATQQSFREHRLIRQQYHEVEALRTPTAKRRRERTT